MKNIDIIKNANINLLGIILSEISHPFPKPEYNYCELCKDKKCLLNGCDIEHKKKIIIKWLKKEIKKWKLKI